MSDEEKTTKTIRDYPINKVSPFTIKGVNITEDRSFSVSMVPKNEKETAFSRNLTGVHIIDGKQAVDLTCDVLKNKLHITKGGINVFKYLYYIIEQVDGEYIMTIKVDFDDCRDVIGYTSTQSVWYGLAELLDKDIIARSGVPAVYFLNPNYFHPAETIIVTEYYKIQA